MNAPRDTSYEDELVNNLTDPSEAAPSRCLCHQHPPRSRQATQAALLAVGGQLDQLGGRAHGAGKVFEEMVGAGNKGLGIHSQATEQGRRAGGNGPALVWVYGAAHGID